MYCRKAIFELNSHVSLQIVSHFTISFCMQRFPFLQHPYRTRYLTLMTSDIYNNQLFLLNHKTSGRIQQMTALAKKYLCIPATSTSVERLFSVAGAIIRARRSSLASETVELLIL
jgi:hypothetical protein